MSSRILLVIISTLYILFFLLFGRQETTDELYFKIAGVNWARDGLFNAPELFDNNLNVPTTVDDVFFLYMPLYSFLFGIFVKCFGFGWQQVVLFDALIHLALIWVIYLCASRLFTLISLETKWVLIIPSLLVLPIGQSGRPDELAMVFGYLGILALLRKPNNSFTFFASGILLGLCALTSSAAAIIFSILFFMLVVSFQEDTVTKIKFLVIIAGTSLFVFIVGLSPLFVMYPGAIDQYIQHAQKYIPGEGKSFTYYSMMKYGQHYLTIIFLSIIFYITYLFMTKRTNNYVKLQPLWIGVFLSSIFVFWFFPIKYTYLWFFIPLALILITITIYLLRINRDIIFIPALFLAIVCSPLVYAQTIRDYIVQITLDENQTIRFNEKFITENIESGSTVVTQRGWWYLADKNYKLLDSMFSSYDKLEEIDYIVLTANGSGRPGIPHQPASGPYRRILAAEFKEIANNLKAERNELYSIPLSNSGNGHGVVIFKRKNKS